MKKYELLPTLNFSEFSYINEHKATFAKSELGILHSLIPFETLELLFRRKQKRKQNTGRPSIFSTRGKIALMILKSKYTLSDKQLLEHLNSNISFQLFCDIIIPPLQPLTDFKIISRIRTELANNLDMMAFQQVIANVLKQHISSNDLRISMSDATCYESHIRFPTNQKLLWESIESAYKIMVRLSHSISQRVPRTKYLDIADAYLSFSKTRRKSYKKKRRITRRLLALLKKLISEINKLLRSKKAKLQTNESKRFNIIKEVLEQQIKLFNDQEVKGRIVSLAKPYIRPIVRGKESKAVEFGAKVNTVQVGGFNFIEHIDFNAFHEGIRVPECILLHKILFHIKPSFFAGDALYATNKNRSFCNANHIKTNFIPKGRQPKVDNGMKEIRRELNIIRSTVLEGSFGTEKENYSLRRVKAKTKKNEILWILFGIHTANFSRLASRIYRSLLELRKAT